MKIAFWSNVRGKSCVTSNLACISILSALNHPGKRMIVFENHQNIMNLETTYMKEKTAAVVNEPVRYTSGAGTGLKRVFQLVEEERAVSEDNFLGCARDFLGRQLIYVPAGNELNAEVFEYQMNRDCLRTLDFLERYAKVVMIDTSASPLESSRRILQEADLVVVNLSQNERMLSHFFRNYSGIRKKAFYVVGNYEEHSALSRDRIIKKYQLDADKIGIIPHNIDFQDAISQGNLIPFLVNHFRCRKRNDNYAFMKAAKETEELFYRQLCRAGGIHRV